MISNKKSSAAEKMQEATDEVLNSFCRGVDILN